MATWAMKSWQFTMDQGKMTNWLVVAADPSEK
jgi:hypothetical protein